MGDIEKKTVKKRSFGGEIRLFLRAYRVIRECQPRFILFSLLKQVFEIASLYVTLYASALVINGLTAGEEIRSLIIRAVTAVTVVFALNIAGMLFNYLEQNYQETLWNDLSFWVGQRRLEKAYEYAEDKEKERLFERARYSLGTLSWNEGGISKMFRVVFSFIASLSVSLLVFFKHGDGQNLSRLGRIVTSSLCFIPIASIILCTIAVNYRLTKRSNEKEYAYDRSNDDIFRVLNSWGSDSEDNHGMDIRIFGLGPVIVEEMRQNNVRMDYYRTKERIQRPAKLASHLTYFITTLILYSYVALKIHFGDIGVGDFVLYAGALVSFSESLKGIADWWNEVMRKNNDLADAFAYIDLPNPFYQGTLPVEKRVFCEGGDMDYEIEFHDVSFRYPGTEDWALRHLSVKFRIGERLAVVGRNGSGKTTFIKMLCRLYDPTEGEILLNGIDIRKYKYEEYLSIFSVVFQDFKLLSVPLGENVATVEADSPAYDRDRIVACCRESGLDVEHSDHLTPETMLYTAYDPGVIPSGGEEQKLALARALYRNAPFIVLDEPTAALDPIAEAEIYARFNEMVGDRTAIYISHRLSSCRFCDEIAVFDHGQIVQKGGHERLVGENGLYRELWNAQAQYYERESDG